MAHEKSVQNYLPPLHGRELTVDCCHQSQGFFVAMMKIEEEI